LYWTVDVTGGAIEFYYKPPTNGAGIGISMSSGFNHSATPYLSFVSDGTHVLPYDTGSTTAPATPEGGTSGSIKYTDYKQLATTDDISTVMLYDKIIRTQAEFDALIDSPTWLDRGKCRTGRAIYL
jgi:hypothetical protein